MATGLSKTLGDIASTIKGEIGDCGEGRVLLGAVSRCSRLLTGGMFDVVFNKGHLVSSSDPHSIAFGKTKNDAKLAMDSLVIALKSRREIAAAEQADRAKELAYWNECVANAKAGAILALGKFIDSAIDTEVERRLPDGARGEVEAVRAILEMVRGTMCEGIQKM